jgi:hypothetical protein
MKPIAVATEGWLDDNLPFTVAFEGFLSGTSEERDRAISYSSHGRAGGMRYSLNYKRLLKEDEEIIALAHALGSVLCQN